VYFLGFIIEDSGFRLVGSLYQLLGISTHILDPGKLNFFFRSKKVRGFRKPLFLKQF
jgi:hypothetical protein